jgi:putative transposase
MYKQELRRSCNAVFRMYVHLVLATKYRKKVLTPPMLKRCEEILRDTCATWGCELVECGGEADHVHALIEVLPKVRLSDLVNNLKTVTSRRLRSEFGSLRKAYGKKAVLWSPSYCMITAGGAPLEILKRYIQNQSEPA